MLCYALFALRNIVARGKKIMDDLITKKQFLQETGLSYGQLYRWKRAGLLPDEWFMKRSATTGQETFFPRERMLARVAFIQERKDKYSLEELAAMLKPDLKTINFTLGETCQVIDAQAANRLFTGRESVGYGDLLLAVLAEEVPAEVQNLVLDSAEEWATKLQTESRVAVMELPDGQYSLLVQGDVPILPGKNTRLLGVWPLYAATVKLNSRLENIQIEG